MSKNSWLVSIPINFLLPIISDAIPVVELPVNGSRITAPGFVEARITRFKSSIGFWVGCLPNFF